MSRSQREKGKRGERSAAKAISAALKCTARRGVQYKGGAESADLEVDIEGVHWEVKAVERESIRAWMRQAMADAGTKIPVVMHKKSREPWLLTLPVERLYEFLCRMEETAGKALSEMGVRAVSADIPDPVLPPPSETDAGDARILPVR